MSLLGLLKIWDTVEKEYENELSTLSPYQKKLQLAFEKKIELLILYKQMNQEEEVYLNEESINKAILWFTNNIKK